MLISGTITSFINLNTRLCPVVYMYLIVWFNELKSDAISVEHLREAAFENAMSAYLFTGEKMVT